jgi:hypothetical protein
MGEIMYGSTCNLCNKPLPAEVGVKSFNLTIIGSEVEESCDQCHSILSVPIKKLPCTSQSICEGCAYQIVLFMNDMVKQENGD